MKILAIADLFVPCQVMRDALHSLQQSHLDVIVWSHPDESELHHCVRQIEREGPEAVKPPDGVWQVAREAELLITHMCPIGAALIRHATHLRTIGVCRAGLETIAVDAALERSVSVVNVPGRNAIAVVEFPVGLILSERRNIARAHHAIVAGGWRKVFSNHGQETELAEKTIGIIGFGAIGAVQRSLARVRPWPTFGAGETDRRAARRRMGGP